MKKKNVPFFMCYYMLFKNIDAVIEGLLRFEYILQAEYYQMGCIFC